MPRECSAYLQLSEWPECIPWTEPTRKHAPDSWRYDPSDPGPYPYPSNHITACELGESYRGDVCPWCGVPLRWDEEVSDQSGETGDLWDSFPEQEYPPIDALFFHRECYLEQRGTHSITLDSFGVGV